MDEFPTGGFGAAGKDHITGYCPAARGHWGWRNGEAIPLFPGRASCQAEGSNPEEAQGSAFRGSCMVSAQNLPLSVPSPGRYPACEALTVLWVLCWTPNSSSFERKLIAEEPRARQDSTRRRMGCGLRGHLHSLHVPLPLPSPQPNTHTKASSWDWAAQVCAQLRGYVLSVLCRTQWHLVNGCTGISS